MVSCATGGAEFGGEGFLRAVVPIETPEPIGSIDDFLMRLEAGQLPPAPVEAPSVWAVRRAKDLAAIRAADEACRALTRLTSPRGGRS